MVFRTFATRIVLRVAVIFGLCILLSVVLTTTSWFFTPVVIGVVLTLSVGELIYYLKRYQRGLSQFLLTIKQKGYNASFPVGEKSSEKDLYRTFNEIIKSFQEVAMDRETQYQFLTTITTSLDAGIIALGPDFNIKWINRTATEIVGKPGVGSLRGIEKANPALAKQISQRGVGFRQVMRSSQNGVDKEFSVIKRSLKISGEEVTLILIQDIKKEMDIKEVEAWQKLTRVMRHEIMNSLTPIVSLTGAIQQMLKTKGQNDLEAEDVKDIIESLEAVQSRGKGLVNFVNAYKDLSKTPEIHKEKFSASKLITRVSTIVAPLLDSRKLKLLTDIEPKSLSIEADEEQLEPVLINLVKNSIDASHVKGRIWIDSYRSNGSVRIRIRDEGVGMDAETLDRAFVPFFTTKSAGTGIGLSLARQIIQLHGGSIHARSQINHGTEIEITL